MLAVGLMSGTSADGIDAVLARISGGAERLRAEVIRHMHRPFRTAFRRKVLDVCAAGTVAQICELNFELGERFAEAVNALLASAGVSPEQVAMVGSHGQTIHHLPRARYPSTLQIGEPCVIAERTGITTVGDFRVRDMAAGGQGAPLVAYADWALFRERNSTTLVQNIGGIGNVTFVPADARVQDVLAFDTGPGNMVIDGLMMRFSGGKLGFDQDGAWAARGIVSERLLKKCLRHPFFQRKPPKTTGREEFGAAFLERLMAAGKQEGLAKEDFVATATALTAESIARAYKRFLWPRIGDSKIASTRVVLGGGGAANATLKRMLSDRLGIQLLTHADLGIADSAKEALAFAILAHEAIGGRPANVPSATGARRPVLLGKIVPG